MSEQSDTVEAPVEFAITADGLASLRFGPMPIDDLTALMESLSTPEGSVEFARQLKEGVAAEVRRQEEEQV